MNRLLTILLLAAGTAYGQIDNPPTSVNIVDSTATGRAVLTATNAAAAAAAIGLGIADLVTFEELNIRANTNSESVRLAVDDTEVALGAPLVFAFTNATQNAATTRTNLGLGGGVTTNIDIKLNNNNGMRLYFTNGILTNAVTPIP